MEEKIISIVAGVWKDDRKDYPSTYDGYTIVTDSQRIRIGVSAGQRCCEQTGYFMSEDEPKEFIGAYVKEVTVTDTALHTYDALNYMDEGGVMFVNLVTSAGVLQFAAYNKHNGYYGHDARVLCDQLDESKYV